MEINSEDYHDFVFLDGKFVGEFEQMYQKSKDVPWHQDKTPEQLAGTIGTKIMKAAYDGNDIKKILEVGCGYGYILNKINREGVELYGFDLSETAIKRAASFFPEINFFVDNILTLEHDSIYDFVICREVIWYVVHRLDQAMVNIRNLIREGGLLFISLSFPDLKKPFVGKGVFPDPESLLRYLERNFETSLYHLLHRKKGSEVLITFYWIGKKI